MSFLSLSRVVVASGFALVSYSLQAQTPSSRAQEIELGRDRKQLQPDTPSTWERRLIFVKEAKLVERFSAGIAGVRVKIGGMPTGSGFAIGPDFLRQDLARGELTLNAGVQASLRRWYNAYASFGAPSFVRDKLMWEVKAVHHDFNSLPYYGPGPDSEKNQRSNYRLEESSFDTVAGLHPHRYLTFGGSGGYLMVNTGPGKDKRYISSELGFPQAQAFETVPGLTRQTDFLRAGGFAQFDYRDNPNGARSGGNYVVRWDLYSDRDLKRHDFRRLDVEAQQFIPVFNNRRVFAVRGRMIQSYTRPDQSVPFYLHAVLGGGNDLRGYRPYRFADNNMIILNGEYRWEVFSGLDMALFVDAGRVHPRRWQFQFSQMESNVGFGLRFNARNATFMRIDVGFSHEGFQVFVKFNGIFGPRPFNTSFAPHLF